MNTRKKMILLSVGVSLLIFGGILSSHGHHVLAQTTTATPTLTNPLGTTDPRVIIGNIIKAALSVIGSVTLLMFVYGGVVWITSMGNDKLVAKGKAILVWTVLGLGIIAGAYTLTNAVITGLTNPDQLLGGQQ